MEAMRIEVVARNSMIPSETLMNVNFCSAVPRLPLYPTTGPIGLYGKQPDHEFPKNVLTKERPRLGQGEFGINRSVMAVVSRAAHHRRRGIAGLQCAEHLGRGEIAHRPRGVLNRLPSSGGSVGGGHSQRTVFKPGARIGIEFVVILEL